MNLMAIFSMLPLMLPVLCMLVAGEMLLARRRQAALGWILPGVCLAAGLVLGALAMYVTGVFRTALVVFGIFAGLAVVLGLVGFFWRRSWRKRQLARMKIQDLD